MEIEFDEVLRASPLIKELINNQKAKKRKIYYEVSREFLAAGYQVRLWFDDNEKDKSNLFLSETIIPANMEEKIKEYFYEKIKSKNFLSIRDLAQEILELYDDILTAIQIIDLSERHGVVLYNQEKD